MALEVAENELSIEAIVEPVRLLQEIVHFSKQCFLNNPRLLLF
jgi:hypothetical protein